MCRRFFVVHLQGYFLSYRPLFNSIKSHLFDNFTLLNLNRKNIPLGILFLREDRHSSHAHFVMVYSSPRKVPLTGTCSQDAQYGTLMNFSFPGYFREGASLRSKTSADIIGCPQLCT